jgi:hypothetical protein
MSTSRYNWNLSSLPDGYQPPLDDAIHSGRTTPTTHRRPPPDTTVSPTPSRVPYPKNDILTWFNRYKTVCDEKSIQAGDRYNFDETGF